MSTQSDNIEGDAAHGLAELGRLRREVTRLTRERDEALALAERRKVVSEGVERVADEQSRRADVAEAHMVGLADAIERHRRDTWAPAGARCEPDRQLYAALEAEHAVAPLLKRLRELEDMAQRTVGEIRAAALKEVEQRVAELLRARQSDSSGYGVGWSDALRGLAKLLGMTLK